LKNTSLKHINIIRGQSEVDFGRDHTTWYRTA
jgi:hypothetical protein